MAAEKVPYATGIGSAGSHVYYAFETEAGQRPDAASAEWKDIPDLTATPELQESPEMLDYTPLSEEYQHVAIPGLRPLPGSADYTANLTDQFIKVWNTDICDAYDTKTLEGLGLWFVTVMKGIKHTMWQKVVPTKLGGPGLEVDSVVSINGSITPASSIEWYEETPGGGE